MRLFTFKLHGRLKHIFKQLDVDVALFSRAFTAVYNTRYPIKRDQHHTIDCEYDAKDKVNWGTYECGGSIFISKLLITNTKKEENNLMLFQIMMHEAMHWIQFNVYGWLEDRVVEGAFKDECDAESQAVAFSDMCQQVYDVYYALAKIVRLNTEYEHF